MNNVAIPVVYFYVVKMKLGRSLTILNVSLTFVSIKQEKTHVVSDITLDLHFFCKLFTNQE